MTCLTRLMRNCTGGTGVATSLLAVPLTTRGFLLTVLTASSLTGWAQVAPSPAEVARYQGLHAAAHVGDLARMDTALAQGSAIDARDSHGRTPLHVATFARHPDAVQTLIRAGAQHGLLDADRYDAVTIAAVATTRPHWPPCWPRGPAHG